MTQPFRALLALLILVLALPAGGQAQSGGASDDANLMGLWIVKPFKWSYGTNKGCKYEQFVDITKRLGPTRFAGTSQSRYTCGTRVDTLRKRPIIVTKTGNKVVITAPDPGWHPETLTYISPYQMDGKDAVGHIMIYRRPKGPPVS